MAEPSRSLVIGPQPDRKTVLGANSKQRGRTPGQTETGDSVDFDEIDDAIAVELLNNQTNDDLALQDSERQTTTRAGGCLPLVLALVIVVFALACAFT